ncbi:MAG: helix-turn-helix transcriptional regulator [Enterococcaceae bacterium]|jgi:transcriptional regulator with XRE-family HTH domain|nr:helix-turn-helix transcriptional regulator [Enterococcaceae bacterium]
MFGILQPSKEQVGQRIRQVKDEMGISLSEFGNRLGLKKPTLNAYVQGYNLAPLSVIEKISKISGRPVGWFYFGDMEEYVSSYLSLKGEQKLLEDHPEVVAKLKEIFLTDEFKNIGWENEVGYPKEEFIDDCYYEIKYEIMQEEIENYVKSSIEQMSTVKNISKDKEIEAITVVTQSTLNYMEVAGDNRYDSLDSIKRIVNKELEKFDFHSDVHFEDRYLIGKLINMLSNQQQTVDLINLLSISLTNKEFSGSFDSSELISTMQSLRPALIKLYSKVSPDELIDWFEK